ncbi:neurobeachin-like protein 2 isoform X2 [Haemorhous mexicanus]|uniref:neurobeachin-like protein 2 isoform X2 n=1 Tax=Haemorhous mexicanus TaxID=30427 RepID=UPI0028BEC9CE|nr:neurobeachin-like protein 2 isoform X2 [Haemorhous mexicanus]
MQLRVGAPGVLEEQLQKDLSYLQQWLEAFVTSFERVIALPSLEPRRPEEPGTEIPALPREVLQVLSQRLGHCVALGTRDGDRGTGLGQALLLLKFFIIICRNLENIQPDRSPGCLPHALRLLRLCGSQLRSFPGDKRSRAQLENGAQLEKGTQPENGTQLGSRENGAQLEKGTQLENGAQLEKGTQPENGAQLESRAQLENGMLHALHLCECFLDPYQTWRRQLSGESISAKEKSKYKFAPAPLPPEFGAFFQESFQGGKQLPETIQLRIIHLFGAILSGSKPNALQAITPAALEVLLGVLQRAGSGAPASPALLEATLRAVVAAVHVLHGSSPGAGPVSLRSLLDGFFRVLNSQLPQAAGGLIALRVLMLDAIPAMLSCQDRPVLQAVFLSNNCFEHIIRLLQNSKLYLGSSREPGEARDEVPTRNGDGLQQVSASSSDAIAVHALGVLTAIMSNSPSAKEVFKERIGYAHLYEVLRSQGQPTQRLLQELLNMAVEGDHSSFPVRPIRNEQPLLILLAWLPALECRDLQVFLSAWLRRLCEASLPSRLTCVKAGMVGSLLGALATEPALPSTCSQNLLELLRSLGSLSIRPGELRQLLRLLRRERGRGPHPYVAPVIRALSGMARGEGPPRALQSFDLSPGMAGIMVPTIQKWPGGAFAFHAWLCLSEEEPEPLARPKRRQLYSFFTAGGTGFEAFFTAGGVLVVAVCTKKDYMTVALPEFAFNDSAWHCVDIVHVAGRRPFGQNIVSIYADGHLRKTAQLRFPSLHESFTSCCIGSAGHRTTTTAAAAVSHPPAPHGPELVFTQHPVLGRSQSVPATLGPHSWTPTQLPTEGVVATTAAGSQDTEWGSPTSLEGHLGSVAIFCEALQQAQVKALFCAGPNVTSPFTLEGDLVELSGKLLLYYTPQACRNNICLDLSPSHSLDGRLTGHKVVNWDIKDVVNCVGGMGVLLPLLEQVVSKTEEPEDEQETNDLVGPELTSSRNTQGMLIPLGKSSESRLERNSVAAFLLLVKNFLRNHAVNQESLVQCHGPAIIGALLHKVPGTLLDMSTLMASQILMEQVASEGSGFLLHLLYQHLLFDFRIWSNSDFAVRLGHIQYLASVVKDHKQRIRKKYGVQFILDSIRTYYGEKTAATDDIRTVQTSLFSLVKDFFCRSFSGEEMQSLLNYLAGAQDEQQVCGALEVIHSLLKGSPAQEQLFTFLFEPGHVELLFSLLVQKRFSDEVRERVFKVLYKMLKYEKVPERSKSRLKLKDIGYHGLISYLSDIPGSMLLFRCLSEQVLGADPPNYKDLVAVVYLSHRAELSIRLDICRKLFHLIYAQQDLVKQLARLAGWQDTLTKLYVKESYECRQHSLSPAGCPELLRLSEPCGVSPPPAELQELDVFLPLGYEASDQELSEGFSDLSISPSGRTKSFHSYNFKSFDSSDRASRSSSNPGDGPPFDGVYHPLSPFSTSPFDLGLDLASTSSMATAESGTQTPASGPGTPSPLESFKPFPGMRARKSSSLSNVLDESSYQDVLPSDNVSNTSNPQQTPEEELCNLLTNIIFSVTWRGVEGWDEAAWRERGQVFSVLTKLGTACELVRPPDEIKRSLLEMMLESALTDLKESGPAALPGLTHNALKLLRLLQDFLFSEGHNNQALWSEKIYEGVSSLLDKLGVWHHLANGTSDLKEMAQTGLRVLLGYILLQDPQLHSLAYVKLHSLLQTTSAPRRDEACYLLGKLETPLRRSLDSRSETFSWLVPIIRTLMDQCYETLQLQQFLPSLPPTNGSPTFYEDFQLFCTTPEWRGFIEKHVQPTMAQFEMDTFARSHDLMSNFWNACYDAMMSSSQRREQEKAASRKLFQELVLEPAAKRCKAENARHANVLKQANNHHSTVLKQWRSLCRLLTSPRSAWADRNPPEVRWKLSSAETYSRMRLKLVPNLNFDQHLEASALRDNLGADHLQNPAESLPLAMAKEAKVSELEDDQLAEEDLPVLDNQAEPKEQNQREKLVVSEDCELITTVAVVPGRLEVTTQHVYFYDGSSEKEETEGGIGYDFKRPLSHLREVHLRRYNLRRSALELFFIDQANYFLNFRKKVGTPSSPPRSLPGPWLCLSSSSSMSFCPLQVRNKVYSCILGLRPPNQTYFGSRSPQELLKASGLTQKWVLREISNFEYLMQLNTIAGRTYNDLSQYPVFPWILRDYVSETLDLTNPAVFRDLSKPIGVANERHARDVKEKYESFEDPTGTVDKFHYGTHYSNAAGVMHYLIRTEPFTTLHIQLQSGRFDCSDRQFHSVPAAWQARMENPVDVKELIPEFFYFPEFLENQNGFDLGCLQLSNEKVGDVVLPRWARSREDFIQQHRKALESEYVSAHLHEWIDLIFGYKQRGPAAVEALNVFYYCTYEGAVDLDAITDETQRKALEGIISNFGQTPCQLLKEPHPARLSAESAARRLATLDTRSPNVFENLGQLKSFFVEGISDGVALVQAVVPKNQAHSFITQGSPDILVTVSANGLLGTHNWLPYDKNISNYFSFTKDPTVTNAKTQRFLQGPFAPGADLSSRTLAVSPDGKLLFSGGHWDNSLRVTSLAKGKVVGHITRHIDVVTCLSLDLCGIYLISGSRDTTCMVWQVLQQGGFSSGLAPKPVQVLYGHDAEVTCVAISTELDMAVSGSKDGTIITHTVRRGLFIRSLRPPGESCPPAVLSHLAVGPEGQVVAQTAVGQPSCSKERFALHLYSVNGKLLSSVPLDREVTAMCLTEDFVVLGTSECVLEIRELQSLRAAVPPVPMRVPVHSVSVTKEKSHILVGLEDGKLIVVGAGQPAEVRPGQFHRRLWRSTRRISQVSAGETEYNPAEGRA